MITKLIKSQVRPGAFFSEFAAGLVDYYDHKYDKGVILRPKLLKSFSIMDIWFTYDNPR